MLRQSEDEHRTAQPGGPNQSDRQTDDDDDDDDTAHRNKQHTKEYQLKNPVMTARWPCIVPK